MAENKIVRISRFITSCKLTLLLLEFLRIFQFAAVVNRGVDLPPANGHFGGSEPIVKPTCKRVGFIFLS